VRRYETIFILRPDLGETAQKEAIRRFAGLVGSSGGDLIDTDEWGFRELAYRIKGELRGYYVRLDYAGTGPTMNEVERNLKLSDGVLRYLSVMANDQVDPAEARAEIEAHRRRTAEARAAAEAARAAADAARAAAAAERASREEQVEAAAERAGREEQVEGGADQAESAGPPPESEVDDSD
jgi:small subunit ribosomal protein S6